MFKIFSKQTFLYVMLRYKISQSLFNCRYVDKFTVSTHYLKDEDENFHTFHPARLMGLFDMLNADSLVDLINGLGAPKDKIIISVPANAYKFALNNTNENAPRSPTKEEQPVALDRKEVRKCKVGQTYFDIRSNCNNVATFIFELSTTCCLDNYFFCEESWPVV